jgi:2-amino-4-hydroxy-6-hydroxymethyldihydropteridine diphosphokinase
VTVRAYVGVGSNIEPEHNIRAALRLLEQHVRVAGVSTFYRTEPLGRPSDPDFINGVVAIETGLGAHELRSTVLRRIERELGRQRVPDANAPRTIDLDLLVYDGEPLDPNVELRAFVAWPLVELDPALALPDGRRLATIAEHLPRTGMVVLHELTTDLKHRGTRWTTRRSNAW